MQSAPGTLTEFQATSAATTDPELAKVLRKHLGRGEFDRMTADVLARSTDANCDAALDALVDWFGNCAPRLVEFEAMGSSAGAFPIMVKGALSLCTVWAPDFGTYGYFPSAEAACLFVSSNWDSTNEIWRDQRLQVELSRNRAVNKAAARASIKSDGGHYVPGNPLERMHERLISSLRASGQTVIEMGPTDTTKLQAMFPQGRKPVTEKPTDLALVHQRMASKRAVQARIDNLTPEQKAAAVARWSKTK